MKRVLKYKVDPNKDKVKPESIGSVSKNDTVYLIINVENLTDDSNKIKVDILGEKGEDDNKVLIEQKDNEKVEKEGINIKIKLKEAFVSTEGMVNLNIKFIDEEGTITIIGPYFYVNKTFEGDIVEDKDTIDTLYEIKELAQRVEDKLNEIPEGSKGSTWRPSVSEDGLLSWSEDNSDIPPESVNIIGPQGIPGIDGRDGRDGIDGKQGLPGENGVTPHIGDNDNWFIGIQDTGVPARGKDGKQGPPGRDGEIGPRGLPGRDGEIGPVGPQGIPGLNGRDGEQGPKGDNGITPHIGDNGNWFIGDDDTGKPSRGEKGESVTDNKIASIIYNGNKEIHPISLDKETGIFTCAEPHELPNKVQPAIVGYAKGVGNDFKFSIIPQELKPYFDSLTIVRVDDYKFRIGTNKSSLGSYTISRYNSDEFDFSKFHFEIPASKIRLDIGGRYTKLKTKINLFGSPRNMSVSFSGIEIACDGSNEKFSIPAIGNYGYYNIEIEADTSKELSTFKCAISLLPIDIRNGNPSSGSSSRYSNIGYSYKGKPIDYIEFYIDTRYYYIANGAQIDIYGEKGGE
ncbi:hypothetical protein QJR26_02275 [Clostridium baratii]